MIEGFIFDLDGVLVSTPDLHYQAWKRLTESLNLAFTRNDYERLKGLGRSMSFSQILQWNNTALNVYEFEKYLNQKNEWYLQLLQNCGPEIMLPGVQQFLNNAQDLGLRLAVGSASKNAKLLLQLAGLTPFFEVVIDGTSTTHFKPHPEVFLKVAKQLGVAPYQLVVFEDSQAGIAAARTGGFYSVGVGETQFLTQANKVISHFDSINPSQVVTEFST